MAGSDNLGQALKATPAEAPRPVFFHLTDEADREKIATLLNDTSIAIRDTFDRQIRELCAIRHPSVYPASEEFASLQKETEQKVTGGAPLWQSGVWAYFPWKKALVHLVEQAEYLELRTARNRNLITAEEQEKFANGVVGIAGLSVGNSCALAIVLQGGAHSIRLADPDTLDATNLNRIRAGVDGLGMPKVNIAAQQIYEINPYAQITLFPEGVTPENVSGFLDGLDVAVDEMDSLPLKVLLRVEAKKRGIPVVMATDNGDNALLDIERYDQDPNLPLFSNRLGDITPDFFKREFAPQERAALATKVVGPFDVVPRMQDSLLEVGKTLYSWPQLGGAALVGGSAVAYCVRKILTGEPLSTGRQHVSLDATLDPEFNTEAAVQNRQDHTREFMKVIGLSEE